MHISAQNRKYVLVWTALLFIGSANYGANAQKGVNPTEYTTNINTYPKNHIYLNLLGDASVFSLNYDRVWMVGDSKEAIQFLSTKIGLGYNVEFSVFSDYAETYTTIPHHLTYNIGGENSQFEFGLGGTFLFGHVSEYIVYPMMGLRLIPLKHPHFNFRLYGQLATVQGNQYKSGILFFPFGTSLGVSF